MTNTPHSRRYTFDRVVRLFLGALTSAAILAVVYYLSDVLIPFVIAFLLAYLLNPLVKRVQKLVKYRMPAIILSLLLVVLAGGGLTLVLVPAIVKQGQHLGRLLQKNVFQDKDVSTRVKEIIPEEWWQAGADFLKRPEIAEYLNHRTPTENAVPARADGTPDSPARAEGTDWKETVSSFFSMSNLSEWLGNEELLSGLRTALSKAAPLVTNIFTGVYSGLVSIILAITAATMTVMYLFFILRDYERVSGGWPQLIPPEQRDRVVSFVADFNLYMNRYFRAQAVIAMFSALIMAVGFWLMGLPMGILLGLFCGALSMVPYLQAVGFIPAALLAVIYALDSGTSFWLIAAEVAGVFVIAQVLYDVILVPKFMGDVTGLSPAVILLSLSVWGKFLGLLGFLIALPMTCLLLAYYRRLINREES